MQVYVIGLGHIGLPMACFIAISGKQVIGIDNNPQVIKAVKNGSINIYEHYNGLHISKLAKKLIDQGKLTVTKNLRTIDQHPGVFIVSVGIKSSDDFKQDISPIKEVMDTLVPQLKPGDLIIFRTTLIPGTIDEHVIPRLESLNIPVYLAYCPETMAETQAFQELNNNPIVMAGKDEESFTKAKEFFNSISDAPIHKASNIKTAELIKVVQNISRDVEIALVNEISVVAEALKVDTYEVLNLSNTHPRVKLLQPGPGVGGYCLPNALVYLKHTLLKGKNTDIPLSLMEVARKSNLDRPKKIVALIEQALKDVNKTLEKSCIAILGLAMKDNCADCRYSPAIDIAKMLTEKGAKVKGFDPVVGKKFPFQVDTLQECIVNSDCILITAVQPGIEFDTDKIKDLMPTPLVVDTRNVFPGCKGIKVCKL